MRGKEELDGILSEAEEKLTDEEVFTHPDYMAALTRMANVPLDNVVVKTIYQLAPKSFVAKTDGRRIVLNAGSNLMKLFRDRRLKHLLMIGKLGHEESHPLTGSFDYDTEALSAIRRGKWFPNQPACETTRDERALLEMESAMHNHSFRRLYEQLAFHIVNVLQDFYGERMMKLRYPGIYKSGIELLEWSTFQIIPSIHELENEGEGKYQIFGLALLTYTRFGYLKDNPGTPSAFESEVRARIEELSPVIVSAKQSTDELDRWAAANQILLRTWDFMKELLTDDGAEEPDEDPPSPSPDPGEPEQADDSDVAEKSDPGKPEEPDSGGEGDASDTNGEDPIHDKDDEDSESEKSDETGSEGVGDASDKDGEDSGHGEDGDSEESDETGSAGAGDASDTDGDPGPGEDGESEKSDETGSDGAGDASDKDGDNPGPGEDGAGDTCDKDGGATRPGEDGEADEPKETGSGDGFDEDGAGCDKPFGGFSDDLSDLIDTFRKSLEEILPEAFRASEHSCEAEPEYEITPEELEEYRESVEAEPMSAPFLDDPGLFTDSSDFREHFPDPLEEAVDALTEKLAEAKATAYLNDEIIQEHMADLLDMPVSSYHNNIQYNVLRIGEIPDDLIKQYNAIEDQVLELVEELRKELVPIFLDRKRGVNMTGLYMGNRLMGHALYRRERNFFSRRILPNDTPDLAATLLVDCSGSMCCQGRDLFAKLAAIVFYEFCLSLEIPVMVVGHTETHEYTLPSLDLHLYASFDHVDPYDRYRIMDIRAIADNRDGAALLYAGTQLLKRPEPRKLLISISDGSPYAYNYSGEGAEKDLLNVRNQLTDEGITVIAAAIGADKHKIRRCYRDGFLDIGSLQDLPERLVELLKEHF